MWQCNPLGIAAGQILPSLLVDAKTGAGFPVLLLSELIGTAAISLFLLAVFREHPPSPPSLAAHSRSLRRARSSAAASMHESIVGLQNDAVNSESQSELQEARTLLSNREFVKLLCGFGLGLGIFNAVTTVIEQLVRPCGYTSDDAGLFGALIIGGGLLGAAIAGPVMDYTHAYKPMCKVCAVVASIGTLTFVAVLRPGQSVWVTVAFGVLGFAMMPLLPITFETAVE